MGEQSFSGLALWLQPESNQANEVQELMERVREVVQEKPLPPASGRFGPHATLLAGLSPESAFASTTIDGIWTQVLMALGGWKESYPSVSHEGGFSVLIQQPDTRGSYFQAVVLALDKPPILRDLHGHARQLLGSGVPGHPDPPLTNTEQYWPHVSLVYADLDRPKAQVVLDALQKRGYWRNGKVYPRPELSSDGFDRVKFGSLALWSCQGPPSEWTKLHEVQFADL